MKRVLHADAAVPAQHERLGQHREGLASRAEGRPLATLRQQRAGVGHRLRARRHAVLDAGHHLEQGRRAEGAVGEKVVGK